MVTATAYACGESGTLQLSCVEGKTLLILDANYGRTSTDHACPCSTCRADCRAVNSLSVVRSACQGKRQCAVRAAYSIFGEDPCWGVQKYLEASYRCITESNVALGKTTTASSHPSLWGPEKAVDGFRGTAVSWYNQCLHTNQVYQPWWKVDLGAGDPYTVNRVSVLNRGDCCGDRLRNFQVRVGPNENFAQNDQCGETYTARPANGATIVVYCDQPMSGRYVSIQVMGRSEYLQICDVEVFAETADGPKSWRDDLRCGQHYHAENGQPAECDPDGVLPCCSTAAWCGNTVHHCNCRGCVDYRNTLAGHNHPTTCAEAKSLRSNANDGEYTLYPFSTNSDVSLRVYCHDMASENPKEFLTLPSGPDENYAIFSGDRLVGARLWQCTGPLQGPWDKRGTTKFSKLRIQFDTSRIEVIGDDYTFAQTTGPNDVAYGQAGDCYSAKQGCAKGTFKVDLTGTGLALAPEVHWVMGHHYPASLTINDMFVSEDRKVASARCGGWCGYCWPEGRKIYLTPSQG
ncbi:uncharacterized protein LOC118403040 [Branchiostoma floridae]|uniref:Uncharacterized protein LOC118403040 n=1 Tax=Branchiostoma floridae TaxID=7739 RepID=A0A9J7HCU6_BRAFL|nr:uncharacterized protein LOC118403040 [Branchiostoma floridae]